jgi:nucleoside-diphosphate-sugar epimerase
MAAATDTVLVTGASGFIAQHCILELLSAGYSVRGTVRSLSTAGHVREVLSRQTSVDGRLEVVEADLLRDAGWDDAVRGCKDVLHVASPFPPGMPKHEDDLIVPARDGTLRVLRAASKAGVRRVVMTSSLAAVTYGHPRSDGGVRIYDEKDWSDATQPIGAYQKSKTLAERAAWDFVKALPPKEAIELVTVNPGVVLGPILDKDFSTSGEVVKKLMRREMPGCPNLGWAMVDVRDVALMHRLALTTKEAAGQRFICAGDHAWMLDVAKILDRHFRPKGYRVPRLRIPGWVVRATAIFDKTLRLVVNEIGQRQDVSHERARTVLGWKPRALEETVVAMGESLIQYGAA